MVTSIHYSLRIARAHLQVFARDRGMDQSFPDRSGKGSSPQHFATFFHHSRMILLLLLLPLQAGAVLHAHTGFELHGVLAAPAAYDHRRFEATWDSLLDTSEASTIAVNRNIKLWMKTVDESEGTKEEKDARLDAGRRHFAPLLEAVNLAKSRARLATRIEDDKDKDKRSIFGDVLSVFGFGSAMYASHEVASLNKRVIANHKELQISRHLINDINTKLTKWSNSLASTESDTRFFMNNGDALQAIAHHFDQVTDGIIGIRQNTIRPSVISPTEAASISAELIEQLSAKGFTPAHSGVDVIYRAKVSHILTQKGFIFFVHIPIVRKDVDSYYTLYRVLPAVIAKAGVLLKLVPDHAFIAVHKKGSLHIPITQDTMKTCQDSAGVWVCPNLRSSTRFPQSCIACLWFQRPECTSRACVHEWTTVKDDIFQITPTRFAVREETVVVASCDTNITTIVVKDFFELGINCSAVAGHASIQRGLEDVFSSETVTRTFIYPVALLNVTEDYFQRVLPALEKTSIPPVKPLPAQVASLFRILVIAAIVVAVLAVLAGIGFLAYKVFKVYLENAAPPEDVPAHQPPAQEEGALGTVKRVAAAAAPLLLV